jgi:hypothetical protein
MEVNSMKNALSLILATMLACSVFAQSGQRIAPNGDWPTMLTQITHAFAAMLKTCEDWANAKIVN